MKLNIRLLYLYLFSFVGLIVTVIGAIRIIDLGLKVYLFKGADNFYFPSRPMITYEKEVNVSTEEAKLIQEEEEKNQKEQTKRDRQREASGAIAMLLVGFPLYKYHWTTIQKENKIKSI